MFWFLMILVLLLSILSVITEGFFKLIDYLGIFSLLHLLVFFVLSSLLFSRISKTGDYKSVNLIFFWIGFFSLLIIIVFFLGLGSSNCTWKFCSCEGAQISPNLVDSTTLNEESLRESIIKNAERTGREISEEEISEEIQFTLPMWQDRQDGIFEFGCNACGQSKFILLTGIINIVQECSYKEIFSCDMTSSPYKEEVRKEKGDCEIKVLLFFKPIYG